MPWSHHTALHSTSTSAARLALAARPTPCVTRKAPAEQRATLQASRLLLPGHAQADTCIQC